MYQKILIALEGKDSDETTALHAQRLAALTGALVTLLRVVCVADDGGGGLGRQFQLETGSSGWRRTREAEASLSRLQHRLQRAGVDAHTELVIGTCSEGDEIVAYAAESGCDLIIMARDARPWYMRWLQSAQDDDVLQKASVPTLFVGSRARKPQARRVAPEAHPAMAFLGNAEL